MLNTRLERFKSNFAKLREYLGGIGNTYSDYSFFIKTCNLSLRVAKKLYNFPETSQLENFFQ